MKKIIFNLMAFFLMLIIVGCGVENDANDVNNAKSGIYFGRDSLISAESNNARTALPVLKDIQDAYSEIKISSKISSDTSGEYELLVSYEKYSDLSLNPQFFEFTPSTYDFKLTTKINGKDYAEEKKSVTIANTPALLSFSNLRAQEADGKGAVHISFTATTSAVSATKVTAKLDAEAESNVTVTSKDGEITGSFEKTEVTEGKHKIFFYFKDASDAVLLTYPVSAYVYANLTSKDNFSISVGDENTFTIYTVTYKAGSGTGTDYVQQYNPASTLCTFATSNLSAPVGKAFICWNTKSDGSGTIYNDGDAPVLSTSLILYAQYMDFASNAYSISTEDDLKLLFKTKLGLKGNAKLLQDITFGTSAIWSPVAEYSGNFDGNNHSLKKMTVQNVSNAAFIASLKGSIKNLTIIQSTFNGTENAAPFATIVKDGGTIQNCVSNTNATEATKGSSSFAGGIAAKVEANGTITGCTTSGGSVKAEYVGGITGHNAGNIAFTTSEGITASLGRGGTNSSTYAGGITGYNIGTITGSGSVNIPSITGDNRGYIVGKSTVTTVSDDIAIVDPVAIPLTGNYNVEPYNGNNCTITAETVILKNKTKITLTVAPDSSGAIYAAITSTQIKYDAKDASLSDTSSTKGYAYARTEQISSEKTISAESLLSGTYYIRLYNDNRFSYHTGIYIVTVE